MVALAAVLVRTTFTVESPSGLTQLWSSAGAGGYVSARGVGRDYPNDTRICAVIVRICAVIWAVDLILDRLICPFYT